MAILSKEQSAPDHYGTETLGYPEKFDIALKLGNLKNHINRLKSGQNLQESFQLSSRQPDFEMINQVYHGIDSSSIHVTSYVQPYLVNKLWTRMSQFHCHQILAPINLWRVKVEDAWELMSNLGLSHVFSSLPQKERDPILEEWKSQMSNIRRHHGFRHGLALYALARQIIIKHKELSRTCTQWLRPPFPKEQLKPIEFSLPSHDFKLVMGWDLGTLTLGQETFALDRDLFLLIVNKLGELACGIMYMTFQSTLFKSEGYLKLFKFLKIITHNMLRLWRAEGDDSQSGFKLPKSIEAVGVGMIIEQEDGRRGWDNKVFCHGVFQGLLDENLLTGYSPEDNTLYEYMNELTTPEISELIGGIKLVGHPDIDFELGLDDLYNRTHLDIRIDPQMVKETQGAFVKEFIQNYYKRNRTWPPLKIPSDLKYERLKQYIVNGLSPLCEEFRIGTESLTYLDWSYISINQCVEFDLWESPLEFLKDTALSPERNQVLKYCYQNKLHPDNELNKVPITSRPKRSYNLQDSNRLVIQFILNSSYYDKSLEYRTLWHTLQNDEELFDMFLQYMVIKLTPKEREEKPGGRFFGASPFPERDRRIQVEGELTKLLHDYFPDQMLTATALEFNQKLIKFRNYRKMYPNHHIVQLCFDFKAWNNYMRAAFIDAGIGMKLNGIFNTHAYQRIMAFYHHALVHNSHPGNLVAWLGQQGGIEGLNQATWTLATLMGLKVALADVGFKFEVSVKGDDCRAAIMIPKSDCNIDMLHTEISRIKNALTDYCNKTGMQLKPDETFESLCLIASSKQYQVDDIILPCGLKQALKIAHHSNAPFPTSQDIVSDIMSACHGTCYTTPFLIPTWSLGIWVSLIRLQLDYQFMQTLHIKEIVLLCLWPQILGGPGMLPLEVFIVRGENDMLSIVLSLYHHIMNKLGPNDVITQGLWRILRVKDAKIRSWRLLLTDPYGLNRQHPMSPSQYLKSKLRDQIKKITRNPMLKTLFKRDTSEGEKALIDALITLNPAHVKIMVGIYENSAFAQLDRVIARIDNATSVFMLLGSRHGIVRSHIGNKILKTATKLHQNQIHWWLKIITDDPNMAYTPKFYRLSLQDFMNNCPTGSAQQAREESWGIPIFGITYPSITTQFKLIPDDWTLGVKFLLIKKPNCGVYTISGTDNLEPQTNDSHPYFCAPPDPSPWIGGKTDTKIRLPGSPKLHKSAALPKIRNLLEVLSRVSACCPDIIPLIKWTINMMVYLTEEEYHYLIPDVTGGSVAHRLPIASYSQVITPNYRHNIMQSVKFNYDRIQYTHSQLRLDYTLAFAAIYIHHAFILTYQWMLNYPKTHISSRKYLMLIHEDINAPDDWVVHPCPHCLCDVSDRPLTIEYDSLPDVDLEDSLLVVLPPADVKQIKDAIEVLKQQRIIHSQSTLNTTPRGTQEYLNQANKAILNKLVVDAKRYVEQLYHIAPGGVFSDSIIQAAGVTYSPLPIKFLNWIRPDLAAAELIDAAKNELLQLYDLGKLLDQDYHIKCPTGSKDFIYPILKLMILAGIFTSFCQQLSFYNRHNRLSNPLIGADVNNIWAVSKWIYITARLKIQKEQSKRTPFQVSVTTTHNETMEGLLDQVTRATSGVVRALQSRPWSTCYTSKNGLFFLHYPHINKPCDLYCPLNGEDFLSWFAEVAGDWDTKEAQWLLKAILIPIGIHPAVVSTATLMNRYQSPDPGPIAKYHHPRVENYRSDLHMWTSINSFVGFNVLGFLNGECGHRGNELFEEFMQILEAIQLDWEQSIYDNSTIVPKCIRKWESKIENAGSLTITHMESEAALSEVAENPHATSTLLSELQDSLQNPRPLHQVGQFVITFRQAKLPTSHGAALQNIVKVDPSQFPVLASIPHRWLCWNQHLRIRGYSGTAACKLYEIFERTGILRSAIGVGVSIHLADGYGGFCTLTGLLYPQLEVYHNTLKEHNSTPGSIPGDWLVYVGDLHRIHSDITEEGDLCDRVEAEELINYIQLRTAQAGISLLTFDAEYYGMDEMSDYLLMIENAIRIYRSTANGRSVLVMKLFYHEQVLFSSPIIHLIDTAVEFQLYKLYSSRETNLELYLVINGTSSDPIVFDGNIHVRRYRRYVHALDQLTKSFHIKHTDRSIKVNQLLHKLINSRNPPLYTSKHYELLLRIPPGALSRRTDWENNEIGDRLKHFIDSAEVGLLTQSRHLRTPGRRQRGVGGVSLVKEWTGIYTRGTACRFTLSLGGGVCTRFKSTLDLLQHIHDTDYESFLDDEYNNVIKTLIKSNYWNYCQDHEYCLTSKDSILKWANSDEHLDMHHEFGIGCDVGVRMLTLGTIYSSQQVRFDIFDEITK